jgi:8-oxo-dGTP pyrophosphatase MutT (NUDIX family)
MSAAGFTVRCRSTGRLLLLQRWDGVWELPGGHAEPGETPWQTARRELAEETGYTGSVALDESSGGAVVFLSRGGLPGAASPPRPGEAVRVYIAFAIVIPREFRPVLAEHRAAGWFTCREAVRGALDSGARATLEAFSASRNAEPWH